MSDQQGTESPRRARGRPKAWDDKTEQNTIKSLDRAMAGFSSILSTMQGATLSELAADTGQSPATTYSHPDDAGGAGGWSSSMPRRSSGTSGRGRS